MPHFTLRSATDDDLLVTYAITESAMRAHVEQTFGAWVDQEQQRKHCVNFTPATHTIILVDEDVAGFFALEEFPSHIWLVKLYLFQQYQCQGIGSQVLRDVMGRARAATKPVTLRVLRSNTRAQSLYLRNGFRVIEETRERLFMRSAIE